MSVKKTWCYVPGAALVVLLLGTAVTRAQQTTAPAAPPSAGSAPLVLQPPAPTTPTPEVVPSAVPSLFDAAPPTDPAAHAKADISFLQLLLKGGWFMVPMIACSLLGLAVIFERLLVLRRGQIMPPDFMEGLESVYRGPADTAAGLRYCQAHRSPLGRIMAAGIRKLPQGEADAERAIADTGGNEVAKLRRNLRTLHGIAAVAPTLGLLGTTWGMIVAFQAASRVGLGHSETLTTGIYEALVTTLSGLMIAIPVLMAYYFFVGRIDHLVIELNDLIQDFLARKARLPAEPPLIAPPRGMAEPVVAEEL